MKSFRFIDLFAGLGGFHVALKNLGGKCVFAAECIEHLRTLYDANHGMQPAGDITLVAPKMVPDHELLTAGFPCQPFSKAGDQLGFECTKQGSLFFNVAAILRVKKPRFFILENVPHLLKHDEGRTWKKIQDELGRDGLGYHIKAAKLSPHNFGIPQIRERVYIVGSRKSLSGFEWPATTDAETAITTVLDSNPAEARRLSPQVVRCLEVWNDFLARCPSRVELPSFPLWSMEWGATYPFETHTPHAERIWRGKDALLGYKGSHKRGLTRMKSVALRWAALPSHARVEQMKFPKWKQDFIRQNRQFYADNKSWIDPWMGSVLQFPSSLQKLEWNVKGGARDIWQYVLQFRASGVRVKRRTTAPSLIAMTETQVPIIAWERRYMTPKECARLQSLDTLRQLPDTSSRSFQALGNAVNTSVVERVAGALLGEASATAALPAWEKAWARILDTTEAVCP